MRVWLKIKNIILFPFRIINQTVTQCKQFIGQPKKSSVIIREFYGIMLGSLALAITLSLISYNELDNALNVADANYHNWLGPAGAIVSETLFSFFGIWASFIPLGLFYLSFRALFSLKNLLTLSLFVGGFILTVGVSPIVAHFFPFKDTNTFLVSGMVGEALKIFAIKYFSVGGLLLICITLSLFALLFAIRRPVIQPTVMFLFSPFVFLPKVIKKVIAKRKQKPVKKEQKKPPLSAPPKETIIEKPLVANKKPSDDINIIDEQSRYSIKDIKQAQKSITYKEDSFSLPHLKLLDYDDQTQPPVDAAKLKKEADKLKAAFLQFGIEGSIREIRPGPVVTNYEFVPAPGIKLSKIAALGDDIAMAMTAVRVRIVTPIPGKGAVGIEVPNDNRNTVYLKEIVASKEYQAKKHKLCMAIGKTVEGRPFFMNLADMPHVLIAGTTGSGKSVSVNSMICSILFRATPRDVRFLMIDPKMLELSIYNGIPHLLLPPIIDAKKAANALKWAVKEMDTRYELMKEAGVRDIDTYNTAIANADASKFNKVGEREHEHLPYIVIVVDEYADLLMIAGKEVEGHIMRLAQKARAAGIHVMLATQRPSVDVITGVIKANFPVRMGFRLASTHDSKTIINKTGAEKLLGKGDVLIMPPGTSDLIRVHGAFISEKELNKVVKFLSKEKAPEYREDIANFNDKGEENGDNGGDDNVDDRYEDAINVVREYNRCSTSFLQRQLSVGYNRAARIVEQMEKKGVVGPVQNAKGEREIFLEGPR